MSSKLGSLNIGVADSRYESTFRLILQNSPSSGFIAIGKSLIHTCIQQRHSIQLLIHYLKFADVPIPYQHQINHSRLSAIALSCSAFKLHSQNLIKFLGGGRLTRTKNAI